MAKLKKLCITNKEALRWCKSRRALIKFDDDAIDEEEEGYGPVFCVIRIGKMYMSGKTLIQVVNKYIKQFNQENGGEQ